MFSVQRNLMNFYELIRRFEEKDSRRIGYCVGKAYFLFQFHIIDHLDDVRHFKIED